MGSTGGASLNDDAIDESVLERLRALQKQGQPDFPSKIVAHYLDTAPSALKEVEMAAAPGVASLLQSALHRLHSASTVGRGNSARGSLQRDRSDCPREQLPPHATGRVQVVADEYARVETALISWRAARA